MPTYEYRCPGCGSDFEKFQRMSDPPVAECPGCGEQAERRLSAGAGLLFKGSGFYITDYRGDSYKKAAEADSGGSGAAKDGKASKGDAAKPAAKSDTGSAGSSSGGSSSGGSGTSGTSGSKSKSE